MSGHVKVGGGAGTGGGEGGEPSGAAGGDLGGTYPNPTVTGLTIASEAQGDVLYRNATEWVRLAPGTAGMSLVTAGPAANPAWGNDYGARTLLTTGGLTLGALPAPSGDIRLGKACSIAGNSNAGGVAINIASTSAADVVTYGGTVNAGIVVATSTGSKVSFTVNSVEVAAIGASYVAAGATGTAVAAAGTFRGPNATTLLAARNQAGGADLICVATDSSNNVLFGPTTGTNTLRGTNAHLSGSSTAQVLSPVFNLKDVNNVLGWAFTILPTGAQAMTMAVGSTPSFAQSIRTTDAVTHDWTWTTQAPWASATGANRNPGNAIITIPAAASGGTEGKLQVNVAATPHLEVDGTIATTETALLLRRNVGGVFSLARVSMGAADSGGAGFKLLRVAN